MTDLTAEMIADLAIPRGLQLSPDGSQAAYALMPIAKRDEHMACAIWLAALDGSRPPRQFTAGTAADHTPQWSPDGTQLAFLSDRAKRGIAQLYLIPIDGGEARALTPADHERPVLHFAWSPGGGQIAFTSADEPSDDDRRREKERDDADVYGERPHHARLRLLSLASGEITTLAGGERHVAGFSWSPSGTELAYAAWRSPHLEAHGAEIVFERIAVAGGAPQRVGSAPGGFAEPPVWASDDTLLFEKPYSEKPQSSSAIWAVPAQGGAGRRLALGEESCAGGLRQVAGAPRAVVEVGAGLSTRLEWLDPASGALEPLYAAAGDVEYAPIDWSVRALADGAVALATVQSSANEPWEVWGGRSESAGVPPTLRKLTSHQSGLAGLRFGDQQPFRWTSADGWPMDGVLVRPPDAPADQPLPTVVLVHGGPYARWGLGFNLSWGNWAQWLALAGYAVLMPNPRGGYGHGERFAAAARGDVGGADYADVIAAVDAAVAAGIADPERLGIGGWSQGGFMSAWAVTQTRRFKAAIMGAGVSDWGMMVMSSDVPDFERDLGGSAPWDGAGPSRHAQISPISFARAAATPVLILHGQNDERVPLSQATGFYRALREVGVPAEFVVYPREPHGIGERAHQIDVLRRVRAWYDRWLRP